MDSRIRTVAISLIRADLQSDQRFPLCGGCGTAFATGRLVEIRDLPQARRAPFPAPTALADRNRDLVECLVPVAAVLAAIVTMLIIWW